MSSCRKAQQKEGRPTSKLSSSSPGSSLTLDRLTGFMCLFPLTWVAACFSGNYVFLGILSAALIYSMV